MKIYYDNNRRLYYWGLLGLIPGIGAVAGIVLIYKAFNHKDKLLALMGFVCILLTVLFYFTSINSDIGKKEAASFSYKQLNNLVSDIELYKQHKGVFPDNLEQLSTYNKHAFICDPLGHGYWLTRNDLYHYKNMGDKYLVFSAGIDQVVNTADDIYPGLLDYGNFKYSFIRK